MNDDPSDADLIERALGAADAARAFEVLYRRHAPCVRAFLRGLTGADADGVGDATQEAFLRAWRALPRFDRDRPLRPWLLTIAARAAIDAAERRRRAESLDPAVLADLAVAWPDARSDVRDAVGRLLAEGRTRLSPRALDAFLLSRAYGLAHGEVAARLGASLATVKRDLNEAARVLAGVAVELGLVPARVVVGATNDDPEGADVTTTWTPPQDGAITAEQLDAVLLQRRSLYEELQRLGAAAEAGALDAAAAQRHLEAVEAWDAACDARDEELHWATGVVVRAARALASSESAARERLMGQVEREVRRAARELDDARELLVRAERPMTPQEGARAAAELEAEAQRLERQTRAAAAFLRISTEELERAERDEPLDEAGRAAFAEEEAKLRGSLAAAATRAAELRRRAADPEPATPEERAKRAAEERGKVQRAEAALVRTTRARDALARALAGTTDEARSVPASVAEIVRGRLGEVVEVLGDLVVGGVRRRERDSRPNSARVIGCTTLGAWLNW